MFSWDCKDMHGIDPYICMHHIYIQDGMKLIRQPQCGMKSILKDIVKDKLQKLLTIRFIYPIYNNKWVYPLLLVPKKGGKSCIYVDYRELNKSTRKYHFPLPFIDQVLDSLSNKQ